MRRHYLIVYCFRSITVTELNPCFTFINQKYLDVSQRESHEQHDRSKLSKDLCFLLLNILMIR